MPQAIHLVVITIFMLMAAQNANVSVWQHIKTQSQMGRGLPLAGLKRQKIKQWKYAGPVLTDAQVLELSSAFRQNRSVENVRITAAFSREEVCGGRGEGRAEERGEACGAGARVGTAPGTGLAPVA